MRPAPIIRALSILLIPHLPGCGTSRISGEISADGSCAAIIDGTELTGPEGGVRVYSGSVDPADPDSRFVLVVYCRLSGPDEDPLRIDFVKLDAPATGVLEPGQYLIDTAGDQPRTIGVVVTAPELLDEARDWQPTSGTLEVTSATATSVEATFEMELRARGALSRLLTDHSGPAPGPGGFTSPPARSRMKRSTRSR